MGVVMGILLGLVITTSAIQIKDLQDRVEKLEHPSTTTTTTTEPANVGITCTIDGYEVRMDEASAERCE